MEEENIPEAKQKGLALEHDSAEDDLPTFRDWCVYECIEMSAFERDYCFFEFLENRVYRLRHRDF